MVKEPSVPDSGDEVISVLLVDDITETRENIRKLLAFESDFKVVGSVGTGRDAVEEAKKLRPDIIIMDINMPDMDGIQATGEISKVVPTAAVIMMSVQRDSDYLRKAMMAGARDFLIKPIDPDEMYSTIRMVHARNKPIADQYRTMADVGSSGVRELNRISRETGGSGPRAGHVVLVYSPQGGAGCTTIATNLASGLMRKGIRVLLLDADVQFGDVGVFLKLQAESTLADLVQKVDDLDVEFFDNVAATHESGLKVLLGPPRPEYAEEVTRRPEAVKQIIEKVSDSYDFIVVDTSSVIDDMLLGLMDVATKIVLVTTPTLASIKNVRFVLDLFDNLNYPQSKTMFVLNRMQDERQKQRVTIPAEVIEKHLKRSIDGMIPLDERVVLNAVNKGVPVIASQRERNRSPIKELVQFSDVVYDTLMGDEGEMMLEEEEADKSGSGLFGRLGLGRT